MNQGIKRKRIGEWGFLLVLIIILFFVVACEGQKEETGEKNTTGGAFIEKADLAPETTEMMSLFGNTTDWVYRINVPEESRISLTVEYYEDGEKLEDHGPILNGDVSGEGTIVIDYDRGEFLMGIGHANGQQRINTTLNHPESRGHVMHSLEERITLETGKNYIGAIVLSGDGRIQSRGIMDEEGIRLSIEENDYVYLFVLEFFD